MKVKLIATDLDDTLLLEDGSLGTYTKAVLQQAIAQGVEVVPASGRAYDSLPSEVLSLAGIRYVITSNGCCIYDLHTKERIFSKLLDVQTAKKAWELLKAYPDYPTTAFYEGKPYAATDYVKHPERYGAEGYLVDYIQKTRIPTDDLDAFVRTHIDALDSINFRCPEERYVELSALFQARLPDAMIVSSAHTLVEIVSAQAGKGKALQALCKHLGIDCADVIAFGNANNDVEMLVCAGKGIAVSNAMEECRAAADLVIDSNEKEGVAHYISKLLLP